MPYSEEELIRVLMAESRAELYRTAWVCVCVRAPLLVCVSACWCARTHVEADRECGGERWQAAAVLGSTHFVKARVHPWIRLNRVIRDIPSQCVQRNLLPNATPSIKRTPLITHNAKRAPVVTTLQRTRAIRIPVRSAELSACGSGLLRQLETVSTKRPDLTWPDLA